MTNLDRTPGCFGLLPNDPTRPRLLLTPHLDGVVPPNPAVVDWLSRVTEWPMYGNDRVGDCVLAMIGHLIQLYTTYGQGSTVTVSEQDIIHAYSAITGYVPGDPTTDNGTVIQDALAYWLHTGIAGHKILAYAQVDHTNATEVDAAINLFGAVALGASIPNSAMAQFGAGQPWTVVSPDGGIDGGHAIPAGYYSTAGRETKVVTWARIQDVADAWWARYVTEAWIVVAPEWLDASGHSPEGIDLHSLGEDFAQLTGKSNPFPAPGPAPVPVPPPVGDADHVLAHAVRPWVTQHHTGSNAAVAHAVQAWLTAKAL